MALLDASQVSVDLQRHVPASVGYDRDQPDSDGGAADPEGERLSKDGRGTLREHRQGCAEKQLLHSPFYLRLFGPSLSCQVIVSFLRMEKRDPSSKTTGRMFLSLCFHAIRV